MLYNYQALRHLKLNENHWVLFSMFALIMSLLYKILDVSKLYSIVKCEFYIKLICRACKRKLGAQYILIGIGGHFLFWKQELESDMISNPEFPLNIIYFLVLSSFFRKKTSLHLLHRTHTSLNLEKAGRSWPLGEPGGCIVHGPCMLCTELPLG